MARTVHGDAHVPAAEKSRLQRPAAGAHSRLPIRNVCPRTPAEGPESSSGAILLPRSCSPFRRYVSAVHAMWRCRALVCTNQGEGCSMDTPSPSSIHPLAAAPAAAAEPLGTPVSAAARHPPRFLRGGVSGAVARRDRRDPAGVRRRQQPQRAVRRVRQRAVAAGAERDGRQRRRDADRRRHRARRPAAAPRSSRARLGTMLVVRNDATTVSAFTATCTHEAVHDHRLQRRRLPVSVPRLAVQLERRRRPRPGDAGAPPLQRHDRQRRHHDHRRSGRRTPTNVGPTRAGTTSDALPTRWPARSPSAWRRGSVRHARRCRRRG